MIKACIFDMDGTVANTLNSISYFANSALNSSGLPSIDTEEYKEYIEEFFDFLGKLKEIRNNL